MPAAPRPRQASVADWFETSAACALAQAERELLLPQLALRPSWPVLWLMPAAGWAPQRSAVARLIGLQQRAGQWRGDLVCRLPLPMAAQSVGTVVLQHPGAGMAEALLEDVARLLLPGGVLLLAVARAQHPARLLCPGHVLWQGPAGGWRAGLAAHGLRLRQVHRIGPRGLKPEHACVVLEAEKRTVAPVGPQATRRLAVQVATRHSLKVT